MTNVGGKFVIKKIHVRKKKFYYQTTLNKLFSDLAKTFTIGKVTRFFRVNEVMDKVFVD